MFTAATINCSVLHHNSKFANNFHFLGVANGNYTNAQSGVLPGINRSVVNFCNWNDSISLLQAHVTDLFLRWMHSPHTEARGHDQGICQAFALSNNSSNTGIYKPVCIWHLLLLL